MKTRLYFFALVFFVILINSHDLNESISYNGFTLNLVGNLFNKSPLDDDFKIDQSTCKFKWYVSIRDYFLLGSKYTHSQMLGLLNCSHLHSDMIREIYPNDEEMAVEANNIYPNDRNYLYWLLDASELDYENQIEIYRKILSINPNDAHTWTMLGRTYWINKDKNKALNAYTISCNINDYKGNGCYHAGFVSQELGKFENALYYYQKSYWPPSKEKLILLEAELSSQNP